MFPVADSRDGEQVRKLCWRDRVAWVALVMVLGGLAIMLVGCAGGATMPSGTGAGDAAGASSSRSPTATPIDYPPGPSNPPVDNFPCTASVTPPNLSCLVRTSDVVALTAGGTTIGLGKHLCLPSSGKHVYVDPYPETPECNCRISDVQPNMNWCVPPIKPEPPAAPPVDLSCKTKERDVVAWVNQNGKAAFQSGIIITLPSSQRKVYLQPGVNQDCDCQIVDVYPDVNWCTLPGWTF